MESEKPVIDFARVRTFTWVIGVGSPAGARRGRGDHRPDPAPFPADDRTPSRLRTINTAGSCALKTVRGRVRGESDRGSATAIGPRTTGRESPPPPLSRRMRWTIGRRRGRMHGGEDARVKRRAAAASPLPWRTCQNADVQRDRGTRSPTGCWVWETTGPPSDADG